MGVLTDLNNRCIRIWCGNLHAGHGDNYDWIKNYDLSEKRPKRQRELRSTP
jgi:hypothetical protein